MEPRLRKRTVIVRRTLPKFTDEERKAYEWALGLLTDGYAATILAKYIERILKDA